MIRPSADVRSRGSTPGARLVRINRVAGEVSVAVAVRADHQDLAHNDQDHVDERTRARLAGGALPAENANICQFRSLPRTEPFSSWLCCVDL
jgi:hypothetical protein